MWCRKGGLLTRLLCQVRCVVVLLMLVMPFAYGQGQVPAVLGVSPWTHPNLLFNWAKPVLAHIEQNSGLPVTMASAKDLKAYYEKAVAHEFDALIAPITMGYHLIQAHQFEPLMWVRVGYQVLLVCDANGGFQSIADLQGVDVAFPMDYASTTLVAKQALKQAGVTAVAHILKDQWKVIETLHSGAVPCVAVLSNLYDAQAPELKARFREVYRHPLKLDAMLIAPASSGVQVRSALMTLGQRYSQGQSIVQGFEVIEVEEFEFRRQALAAELAAFKDIIRRDAQADE